MSEWLVSMTLEQRTALKDRVAETLNAERVVAVNAGNDDLTAEIDAKLNSLNTLYGLNP